MAIPDLPPTHITTQDALSAGQKKVNILWEATQAVIAVSIIGTCMGVAARLIWVPNENVPALSVIAFLGSALSFVLGAYFTRTGDQPTIYRPPDKPGGK